MQNSTNSFTLSYANNSGVNFYLNSTLGRDRKFPLKHIELIPTMSI